MGTSREGVNFVRSLVEKNNSIFQEIDAHNDIGNDAYIEFVLDENATGCCVAIQIKSGPSYRVGANRFEFQSDRDHFEYWASHSLPVFAVFYDPVTQDSAWADLTDHLRQNPDRIVNGPYGVSATNELSNKSFDEFKRHCLAYRDLYSRESNLGRALEKLSARENIEECFDGLKALFSFHRQQFATWYFLVSCLRNFRDHPLLRPLVALLCHIPGHGDIFWHQKNMIDQSVRRRTLTFMRERFDQQDALVMLSAIDEAGIDRGTIGQCVHTLVDTMEDVAGVMESIAGSDSHDERIRHSAILFAVSATQSNSTQSAIELIERIRPKVKDSDLISVIDWVKSDLVQYGYVGFY